MRPVTLLVLAGLAIGGAQALAGERQAAGRASPTGFAGLGLEAGPGHARQSRAGQQIAQCCKICRKGKACGDSCIRKSYTCHKPPGCACDAN